jgi:hypothetical protein
MAPVGPPDPCEAGTVPLLGTLPVRVGTVRFESGLYAPFPTCRVAFFPQPFAAADVPNVLVVTTVVHDACCNNAVSSWTTDVTAAGVTVCAREFNLYAGTHPAFNVSFVATLRATTAVAAANTVAFVASVSAVRTPVCVNVAPGGAFTASVHSVLLGAHFNSFVDQVRRCWPSSTIPICLLSDARTCRSLRRQAPGLSPGRKAFRPECSAPACPPAA